MPNFRFLGLAALAVGAALGCTIVTEERPANSAPYATSPPASASGRVQMRSAPPPPPLPDGG